MKGEVLKDFLMRLGFDLDERGMGKFARGVASTTTRVLGLASAAQAVGVMLHAALYKIASDSAKLLDLADATGVSVDILEELGFMATVTGSDADKLAASIQNLNKNMAETLLGGGAGIEAFRRLGINVHDSNRKLRDTVDVLFEVGDRLKDLSPAQRSMFLSRLGIDQSLVRMLTEDVSGLRDTYRDMYAASGVDAQRAAEQSRAYVEETKTLKATLGLLSKSVAMAVIGRMGEDLAGLRRSIQENFKKISQAIQAGVNFFLRLVGASSAFFARIGSWISMLVDWFDTLDSGTQNLILTVGGLLAAWRLLNLGFLATPLGMILTGLLAIVALVDDFMTYMEGGQSLLDWGPWAGTIMEVVDALRPLFDVLGRVWNMVKGPLFEAWGMMGRDALKILGDIAKVLANLILAVVRLLSGDFSGAVDAAKNMLKHFFDWIMDTLGAMGHAWSTLKGWFGGGDEERDPRPALTPSPALTGAVSSSATLHASTVIQVDGARDPEATARSVGAEQRRTNSDLVRNLKGAVK
ncbi:MAG: hypothetical protein AB7E51_00200 [Pseudodesulfovibrio sp.]|uniref:hypothetical protein n=1 Tax=Pseudodesulfovibrio sp. TaxID=2035812 RepID=UPI003D0DC86A